MTLPMNDTISIIFNTSKSQCTQANASQFYYFIAIGPNTYTLNKANENLLFGRFLYELSQRFLHHYTTAKEIMCYSRCKLPAWIEGPETTTWNKTNASSIVSSLATPKNKYTLQPLWFYSHKNDSLETVMYSSQSIHWVLEWMLN